MLELSVAEAVTEGKRRIAVSRSRFSKPQCRLAAFPMQIPGVRACSVRVQAASDLPGAAPCQHKAASVPGAQRLQQPEVRSAGAEGKEWQTRPKEHVVTLAARCKLQNLQVSPEKKHAFQPRANVHFSLLSN